MSSPDTYHLRSRSRDRLYLCSDVPAEQYAVLKRYWRERDVTVVSALSSQLYRKLHGGHWIQRLGLRFITKVGSPLLLLGRACFAPRRSLWIVTSSPFFAAWLLRVFLPWKGHFVGHLLYDLYPDAIETVKPSLRGHWVCRWAAAITRATQQKADVVIYLGHFLQVHTEVRYGPARLGTVIQVAADNACFQKHWPEVRGASLEAQSGGAVATRPSLAMRYGGQLGHMHCAALLGASVRRAVTSGAAEASEFSFFVSGAGVSGFKRALQSVPVRVEAPEFEVNWREGLVNYDLALVSLSPGGATVCFPSKAYAMLAAGLALLAICPVWSDLGQLILQNEVGWVVHNAAWDVIETPEGQRFGDGPRQLRMDAPNYLECVQEMRPSDEVARQFASVVHEIRSEPDRLLQRRRNAWRLAHETFNEAWWLQSWGVVEQGLRQGRG